MARILAKMVGDRGTNDSKFRKKYVWEMTNGMSTIHKKKCYGCMAVGRHLVTRVPAKTILFDYKGQFATRAQKKKKIQATRSASVDDKCIKNIS